MDTATLVCHEKNTQNWHLWELNRKKCFSNERFVELMDWLVERAVNVGNNDANVVYCCHSVQCRNSGHINSQLYDGDAVACRSCSVSVSWSTKTSCCHSVWRSHYQDMGFWYAAAGNNQRLVPISSSNILLFAPNQCIDAVGLGAKSKKFCTSNFMSTCIIWSK